MPSGHLVENEYRKHVKHEGPAGHGGLLRDIILGGQDGVVNVLGVLLGVATATSESRLVVIAGLATTFAESISMAAVAYTSTKAEDEFYQKELEREKMEMRVFPQIEREEIRHIYYKKGLRGKELERVVRAITSNDKVWLETMMTEELGLSNEKADALKSAFIVGVSAFIGSLIPVAPFILIPVTADAAFASVAFSAGVLFVAGVIKAKMTVGDPLWKGLELMGIGMASALAGYLIGALFGTPA